MTIRGARAAAPAGARTKGGVRTRLALVAALATLSALLPPSSARAASTSGSSPPGPLAQAASTGESIPSTSSTRVSPERGDSASSDLLLALDADGRSYLAQHTLASEGALIILALPGNVDADHVRFAGHRSALFDAAHRRSPGRLSLWGGSVFVRYRHRYADAAVTERDGVFSLDVPSVPPRLTVEDGELVHSSITWALPDGFEFVSLGEVAPARGRWERDARSARFEQRGLVPIELTLSYRRIPPEPDPIACLDVTVAESDACSPDLDGDGVPDHRDVCLPAASGTEATGIGTRSGGATSSSATSRGEGRARETSVDAFGCRRAGPAASGVHGPDGTLDTVLVLDDIVFPDGQSYLEANARRLLDRLALALMRFGEGSVHEIVAHTDGVGSARRERQLSMERARAVRHYLMLRGVGPNRLRASGAGEAFPVGDDTGAAGRLASGRIELRPLDTGSAPSPASPAQ